MLYLADGRRFRVTIAEQIAITSAGRTVIVVLGDCDHFDVLDAELIIDVEIDRSPSRP